MQDIQATQNKEPEPKNTTSTGKWNQIANDSTIQKTIRSLKQNGIEAEVVETGQQAKKRLLELIPQGAEVMTMTSRTLDTIGATESLDESGKYASDKKQLMSMGREGQAQEMHKIGGAPQYATGSVHAVTEDGHVLIASNSGSQLPAYAYGALNIVWVVGAQKIVKNTDEGIKRIYEHSFPLEDERAQKAYGVNSNVRKILIINSEGTPGRIHLIFVKEKLGF